MGLGFFAVVPRFLRPADIAVTVCKRQELEHDERMRLGHANLGGKFAAVRKFA
jgi:hypothetical protein